MKKLTGLISKSPLILVSIVIIINFYVEDETFITVDDLLNYFSLFCVIILLDITFYLSSITKSVYTSDHYFRSFPITRYRVLYLDILNYIKRPQIIVFIISTYSLFYKYLIGVNSTYTDVLLTISASIFQYLLLILISLTFYHIFYSDKPGARVKIFFSFPIWSIIILVSFVDESEIAATLFYMNPLTVGCLSYLVSINYFIIWIGIFGIILCSMIVLTRIWFKAWPISNIQSSL